MRTVLQESYADRVRRERTGEGNETVGHIPQIAWTSETSTYDAIFPQQLEACEAPKKLDADPVRKFRLSRSPLDSLQAEFRRYGRPDGRAKDVANRSSTHRIHVPHELKDIDELDPMKESEDGGLYPNDFEHSDAALVVPDWSFVQRRLEDADQTQDECPSMTTGSTIGSRNSSTRSARSFKPDGAEQMDRGTCPLPECGRMFRDLAAHMITHRAERPEKCPVPTCEYHTKGFARAYDRVRHTLTHFKGVMGCGFCHPSSTDITFVRCDVFLRHLVTAHGVEQVPLSRREELYRTGTIRHPRRPLDGQLVSTCQLCSEPFDAQGFYEHLRGCVLRQVTRNCTPLAMEEHMQQPSIGNTLFETKEGIRNDSLTSPGEDYLIIPTSIPNERQEQNATLCQESSMLAPTNTQAEGLSAESRDIAELTASSRCLSLTSSHEDLVKSSDEETDWTEEAGSPYSEPDADGLRPLLSPVKRQLVDAIMAEFHRVFDQMLRTRGGGSSNGTSGYIGSSGSSTYSSSSFISRKRSLSGGSTPPPNDNGDDPHKRRRPDPKSTGGKQPVAELRFACPYYKRNPGRHQTYTSCRDPGFITVARLKEHLYRRHLLPIQCHRCCSTFPNEPTLRDHQRDARGCEIREQMPPEGFDKDQERKLKSKKRSLVYQSEEDKWKGVYRILFPDDVEDAMPSPYIEYQPCNNGPAGESSNVARFQEFSRLELPRLVRRTLEVAVEEEAQPLEDKLKERLVDIVRECQTQLITMFQTTQAPSNVGAAAVALIPALENASRTPPEPATQNSSSIADLPFRGFESVASMEPEFMTMPAQPDVTEQYKLEDGAEGSPDSGYDSAWHSASAGAGSNINMTTNLADAHIYLPESSFAPPQPAAPTFDPPMMFEQQQPNYMSATTFMTNDYAENEYVDLGGYYGLFENRSGNIELGALDPSWGYNTAGGGSSMGSSGMM